jgi:hypothetical protein
MVSMVRTAKDASEIIRRLDREALGGVICPGPYWQVKEGAEED